MGIPTGVPLDLDTSLIVFEVETGTVFYNNVDNPNSFDGFRAVKKYIWDIYKCDIHAAALSCTPAAEYPQMFFTLDRKIAQERII